MPPRSTTISTPSYPGNRVTPFPSHVSMASSSLQHSTTTDPFTAHSPLFLSPSPASIPCHPFPVPTPSLSPSFSLSCAPPLPACPSPPDDHPAPDNRLPSTPLPHFNPFLLPLAAPAAPRAPAPRAATLTTAPLKTSRLSAPPTVNTGTSPTPTPKPFPNTSSPIHPPSPSPSPSTVSLHPSNP
ncbi:unnamed protein product [Closterium sp. NIES-54]